MIECTPLYHAIDLTQRGLNVLPIPYGSKRAIVEGWPKLRIAEVDLPNYFSGTPSNVGVLWGAPSGNVVDVDLDHELAVRLGDTLPGTSAVWGRASKPRSHRLYRVRGTIETRQFSARRSKPGESKHETCMLVEIRSDGSQTIAPGSVHPSGEVVRWDEDGTPGEIDAGALIARVQTLAERVFDEAGLAAKGWTKAWEQKPAKPTRKQSQRRPVPDESAIERFLGALRGRGFTPRSTSSGWTCQCPAHEDTHPSLSISVGGDGRVLLKCHTGCTHEQIAGAVGLTVADLFESPGEPNAASPPPQLAPKFAPIPIDDLLREFPSLRPSVVHGLLRQGEVMNIVAAPKTGKSWFAHDLAVRVSQGKPWFHWLTTECKVLIIDGELHPETLSYRLGRVREWSNLGKGVPLDIDVCTLRGRRTAIDGIREMLMPVKAGTYGLIVLDALYRFMPLNGEENSNETMTAIYNALDATAEHTGAAIVVVHHSSKGNQADKAVTDVGAGAGAQSRAADTHLILRQHEQEGAVVLDAVTRSFTPVKPFVISLDQNGWKVESNLDPTKLKKPRGRSKADSGSAAAKPEPKVWEPAEFATEVVGKTPVIWDEVVARAKAASIKKTDAESLIRRGVAVGVIYEHPSVQNTPKRFACVSPNIFSGLAGGSQGCGPPPAPGACAPGGCGGNTHTPPPPSKSTLLYSQIEDKPQRKTKRQSSSRRGKP